VIEEVVLIEMKQVTRNSGGRRNPTAITEPGKKTKTKMKDKREKNKKTDLRRNKK
jgi:hypothetical protein